MQKKRNIYLTISLCLLAVMSAGLFFFTQEETKPEVNRDYFKLKESEKAFSKRPYFLFRK